MKIKNYGMINNLYYFAVFILSFRYIIATSNGNFEWANIFTYTGWICMILRILCLKKRMKYYVFFFLSCMLGYFAYLDTKETVILSFIIVAFASFRIDVDVYLNVLKNSFIWGISFVFACSLLGFFSLFDKNGTLALGFGNCNILALYIVIVFAILIYQRWDSYNNSFFISLILVELFILVWTDSRTSCFSIIAITILSWVIHRIPQNKIKRLLLFTSVFVFCLMFFEFYIVYKYPTQLSVLINDFLTGRIMQGNYYFEKYGINLLGSKIVEFDNAWHLYLDIGYLNMVIRYGVIYFLANIILFWGALINCISRDNNRLAILILFVLIVFLAENIFVMPYINPICPIFVFQLVDKRMLGKTYGKDNIRYE